MHLIRLTLLILTTLTKLVTVREIKTERRVLTISINIFPIYPMIFKGCKILNYPMIVFNNFKNIISLKEKYSSALNLKNIIYFINSPDKFQFYLQYLH